MIDKEIPEQQYFKVDGGPVLPSLLALRAYLRTIPIPVYEHHVTAQKNDFAAWVEHSFGEQELAGRLRKCSSREQMVWVLDDIFSDARMAKVLADQEVVPQAVKAVAGGVENADGVALQDDAAFEPFKPEIIQTNERISAKYEEVAKRMHDALNDALPEEIEKRIEQLRARHSEIMARISEARRQGRDALIPALVIKQFNPKLALAKATREEKDFTFAELVLNQAEFELKELLEEKIIDVRKEVLALAGIEEKAAEKVAK